MAARTAILLLRSSSSSFSSFPAFRDRIRNAYFLPFAHTWQNVTSPSNTIIGNPRFHCTAAPELTASKDVLKYLRQEKNPHKIRDIFNRRADDPSLGPRFDAFDIAVKKLVKAKALDTVEEILEKLLGETQPCSEDTVIRVMKLYGLAAMPDHVINTFHRLKELGVSPSDKSFSAFLAALIDAGKPTLVRGYFDKIDELGFSPTVYSFNATVNAFCEMKDYESAANFVGAMKEKGIGPNDVTYNTILDSLYARFRREEIKEREVENIVDKLLESSPSESLSYLIRIRRLCKEGTAKEAMALLKEAVSRGFDLDPHTFNSVVISLCMAKQMEEAKSVLEMIGNGRKRSKQGYNMLARHFAKKGDIETAIQLCHEMMDNFILIQKNTVSCVLDFLAKSEKAKSDEALSLLERFRKYLPASFISKQERKLEPVVSA